MKSEFINIKKIPKLIIIVTLFFLASLFQLIPIRLFHIDISNITNYQQLLLTTFSDSILLIILVFIYYKDLKKDFKTVSYTHLDVYKRQTSTPINIKIGTFNLEV